MTDQTYRTSSKYSISRVFYVFDQVFSYSDELHCLLVSHGVLGIRVGQYLNHHSGYVLRSMAKTPNLCFFQMLIWARFLRNTDSTIEKAKEIFENSQVRQASAFE